MSLYNNRFVAVTAGAAILVAASSFGAVAANLVTSADIKDQTIKKVDIGKGAVGGDEVKDSSLKMKDLSSGAQAKLKGNTGSTGPAGPRVPPDPPVLRVPPDRPVLRVPPDPPVRRVPLSVCRSTRPAVRPP